MKMVSFLSCDWGTSTFRLCLVRGPSGDVERHVHSERGVRDVRATGPEGDSGQGFARYLEQQVAELVRSIHLDPERVPLWISGMASSSIGWQELPYASLPFPLNGESARVERLGPLSEERPHPVHLVSGVRAADDVLRGEETQILGILSPPKMQRIHEGCVVILPGTHSKQVMVSAGEVREFRTFLTGELFELLHRHSILRHSVSIRAGEGAEVPLSGPFREGVEAARRGPLSANLFGVRTRDVLHAVRPEDNGAYLSGLLIGDELAGSPFLSGSGRPLPVLICAPPPVSRLYEAATKVLRLPNKVLTPAAEDVRLAVPRGHAVLRDRFES